MGVLIAGAIGGVAVIAAGAAIWYAVQAVRSARRVREMRRTR